MRALLTIVTLLVGFAFSLSSYAQTIFDNLTPQQPTESFNRVLVGQAAFDDAFFAVFVTADRVIPTIPPAGDACEVLRPFVRSNSTVADSSSEQNPSQDLGNGTTQEQIVYTCEYEFELTGFNNCGTDPSPCQRFVTAIRDISYIESIELTCPEVDVDGTCYSLFDVNQADSCPDSTQDIDFVLPNLGQTSTSVCQSRPDGSQCQYDLSSDGEVFITNFEGNCYQNDIEDYDDSGIPQPVESGQECQSIGNGNFACLADQSQTCTANGVCPSGCGNIAVGGADPVFVCLTGDEDNDGTANFVDEDFSGNDPRNQNPTDGDGDSGDDGAPVGDGNGGVTNLTVNVDNSGLEQRQDQSNTLLSQIESNTRQTSIGLGTANQALNEISETLSGTETREEGESLTTEISAIASQSADELNLRQLTDDDTAFVETAFGRFASDGCQNPTFGEATLDFCSQSTRVLTVSEFGLWLLLAWFIWHEIHEVLRRGRGG